MDLKYVLRRFTFAFELEDKWSFLWRELQSLFGKHIKGIYTVVWKGPKGNLSISYYDALTCWRDEVLDKKLYDFDFDRHAQLRILDVGANQGFFTLYMKYCFPKSLIFAYEPVRQSFEVLKKNVADNNFSRVHLFPVGVLSKNCTVVMRHVKDGAGLGDTMYAHTDNKNFPLSTAIVENIDEDVKRLGLIDIVKIDVEGAEYDIVKNMNFWKNTNILVIEFHDDFKPDNIDYTKLVLDAGFELYKTADDGSAHVLYFKRGCMYEKFC